MRGTTSMRVNLRFLRGVTWRCLSATHYVYMSRLDVSTRRYRRCSVRGTTSVRVDIMILHGFYVHDIAFVQGTAVMREVSKFLRGITRQYFSISIRKNVYATATSLLYIVILFQPLKCNSRFSSTLYFDSNQISLLKNTCLIFYFAETCVVFAFITL